MSGVFLTTLDGGDAGRRPLWIMRQAGRYLPEYRALRKEHTFEELCADPALSAEVTLQPMRRFDLDAAIVFADLVTPLAAWGMEIRFAPGPVIDKPLRTEAQIKALPTAEGATTGVEVQETLRRVRAELPGDKALLAFGGAPWTLAAYAVQGQGKTGFPLLRAMMYEQPAVLAELLSRMVELQLVYLEALVAAGADAVQVFDSWAGLLSEREWREHVRPHLMTLLTGLGEKGIRRIFFAHGAPHLEDAFLELPSEGLALCWRSDLADVRRRAGPTRVLQGNLDPAILLAGPDATRTAAQRLLASVPRRGHSVNLGHGILPETPIASVEALLDVVHSEVATPAGSDS